MLDDHLVMVYFHLIFLRSKTMSKIDIAKFVCYDKNGTIKTFYETMYIL